MSAKTAKLTGLEALAAGADNVVLGEEATPLLGMEQLEQAQEVVSADGALVVSAKCVDMAAGAVSAIFPCLQYGPETRAQGTEVLAPLFLKYGAGDSWLFAYVEKWKEEIAAGMFFGGLIVASYKIVKADKAEKAKEQQAGDNVTVFKTGDDASGD